MTHIFVKKMITFFRFNTNTKKSKKRIDKLTGMISRKEAQLVLEDEITKIGFLRRQCQRQDTHEYMVMNGENHAAD